MRSSTYNRSKYRPNQKHLLWPVWVPISFVIGFLLYIIPLPAPMEFYRPEWPALILLFWCMIEPSRFGIMLGWIIGLCVDVLTLSLLGQHALGYCLMAWIVNRLHKQVLVFPWWQQAVFILVVLTLQSVINIWIQGMTGQLHTWYYYFASLPLSMVAWPIIFYIGTERVLKS